ncbi:MAG: ABC transporter substrate-binding protein [Pseudoclavibacter sp.]
MSHLHPRGRLGLAVLAVAGLSLAACSGAEVIESDGQINGEIDYSYWGSPARGEKVNSIITDFEEQFPGATVQGDVSDYQAYVERMTVRAAGGGLSCLIGTQSTFATRYAEQDILRPLDDLIASGEIDVSAIPEEVLAAGQVNGEQFIIPTGNFVRLLAYNEQLVQESGAPAPADDLTWEEYGTWLREVQAGLPEGTYASEIEGANMFALTSWVVAHGEEMFDGEQLGFERELLAEWFQFWLDLTADGATVPPSAIPEQFGALELTPLATGSAASGTRDIPHLFITETALAGAGQDTRVLPVNMPTQSPDTPANILGVNGISMPTTCDNVATAAAFANFFTNDVDAGLAFQSDNGIVTNPEVQEALLADPETPPGVKQNVTIFQDLTERGDLANTSYPTGLSSLTNELTRLYQDVAFGSLSVDEAVDAFYEASEIALS